MKRIISVLTAITMLSASFVQAQSETSEVVAQLVQQNDELAIAANTVKELQAQIEKIESVNDKSKTAMKVGTIVFAISGVLTLANLGPDASSRISTIAGEQVGKIFGLTVAVSLVTSAVAVSGGVITYVGSKAYVIYEKSNLKKAQQVLALKQAELENAQAQNIMMIESLK